MRDPPVNNNFCVRCQMIFDILSQVLLCLDCMPSMWAGAQAVPRQQWGTAGLSSIYVSFGSLSLAKTATCDFCAFVIQVARSAVEKDTTEWQKEITVLLNADNIGKVEPKPDFDVAHENTVKYRKALGFGFYDAKFAAILPPPGSAFLRDEIEIDDMYQDDYFLAAAHNMARLVDTNGVETRRINSYRIDAAESNLLLGSARLRPALCDPNRFATWLSVCEKLHGEQCNNHKRQFKHPIRLLNTSTLHLETFDSGSVPRYFALSYVWGLERYTCLEEAIFLEATKVGFRHDANFHPSVLDAIALIKDMKETYLWVDSLCIVQDRNTDKRAQIYQMDSIYANSTLTIVAAGGDQGGLPGIYKPRTEINMVQAGALMLVADACASSESHWSDDSVWSSRAWTFQEYVLSSRKLIFTADQAYWSCPESSWRESIYLASHTHRYQATLKEPDEPLTDMHTMSIKACATKSELKYLSRFGEIVEEYSRRKLTVQEDRLFAIQGILNTIETVDPRKDHFWTLTTWNFELELDWSDRNNFSSEGEFSSVADHMFPSWSWLSYPGPVAMGTRYATVLCFRFFYNPTMASLDCKRVSRLRYVPLPDATESEWLGVHMSMIRIREQFPGVIFNPDRQIIFQERVVRLGVDWNQELNGRAGRPLTGYGEEFLVDRPSLKEECALWAWLAEIDKTKTEYDFISINTRFRGHDRMRLVWLLDWRNGIDIRAGHGLVDRKVWNSLKKDLRIIVME